MTYWFFSFLWKHILISIVLIYVVILFSWAIIFSYLEWFVFLDALYYTFSLISTVWFWDFVPATTAWKLFTIFYWLIWIPFFFLSSWIFLQQLFHTQIKTYIHRVNVEIEKEKHLYGSQNQHRRNHLFHSKKKWSSE